MSNSFGHIFKINVFGESHSSALGLSIEGLAPGSKINLDSIRKDLARRRPGQSDLTTARKEPDEFEVLSGLKDGHTTGSPLTFIIRNQDQRPKDYQPIKTTPRPSHSDYPAHVKYQGFNDPSGSGQFSARLTAPVVLAGAIAKDILAKEGIEIIGRIRSIYTFEDASLDYSKLSAKDLVFEDPAFPVLDQARGQEMKACILKAKAAGDSVGGLVECIVLGLPVGLGQPLYGSVESLISSAIFSIPGVRGIEFGAGFGASQMLGSLHNDCYYYDQGVKTKTNNHGGILGGLTTGMPLVFSTAFKPTSSIGLGQKTLDLKSLKEVDLKVGGRHDPSIVPRAVPIVEAWAAIVLLDLMYQGRFI